MRRWRYYDIAIQRRKMKRKTKKSIKVFSQLSTTEKVALTATAAVALPLGVIFEMTKRANKPKRRKTGGRGHAKKDYWPHN